MRYCFECQGGLITACESTANGTHSCLSYPGLRAEERRPGSLGWSQQTGALGSQVNPSGRETEALRA